MKRIIEKIKCIYHILIGCQYFVATAKFKDGKRVKGRTCCIVSDNASDVFLKAIGEMAVTEIIKWNRKNRRQ